MPVLDRTDNQMVEKYNAYMKNSPYANVTQDIAWSRVKSDWDNEQVYLEENGEIIAGMSLIIKKVIGGYAMMYAPRGPVCDVYDTELVQRLVDEADPLAKKYNAFVLRLDPEIVIDDKLGAAYETLGFQVRNRKFGKAQLVQPRFNMVLHLDGKSPEELMKQFSEKTRYNIRLSSRKGITVRYSREEEDLKTFYEIYRITTERDRIGSRPYEYFKRMLDAYEGDQLRIYLAEHEGEALSGAICLNYGPKMFYIYGASSNVKRNLMPNYANQWAMIQWALEEKKKLYDFGGVFHLTKEDGLFKFKEGFCRQEGATEYIGEFDRVYKKPIYMAFEKIKPAAMRLRMSLHKK
ncbi:lipid II:glycine glycyltransferase FemX [Candidatus Soleaferrea massiliensis]|uniref:lipid II:glycine glycyltransferase FemX n=1 Tax=Candidatus Soleaferrea massiliensis TaxID=1470354 RepID=UPI00058BF7A5|nr:peptidoglycan bridge formation glycyltransferase FemA/FemB family protein [Candidatus Soleaferrea massiliensis]